MRACIDLLRRLENALADARVILNRISAEERAQALIKARSQNISVELLVAREISVIARDAELEALKRLNVIGTYAAPSFVVVSTDPRLGASLDRSPGVESPKDGSER